MVPRSLSTTVAVALARAFAVLTANATERAIGVIYIFSRPSAVEISQKTDFSGGVDDTILVMMTTRPCLLNELNGRHNATRLSKTSTKFRYSLTQEFEKHTIDSVSRVAIILISRDDRAKMEKLCGGVKSV